tara:strand:+ start:363 stop:671 length:309 start_codon:yes stop_codon:yes gene_type:complete
MEIHFQDKNQKKILEKIQAALGDRPLGKIMSFELNTNNNSLDVIFSKLGKTKLQFNAVTGPEGITLKLNKEKVALAHRPLYSEVKAKLAAILKKAGGSMKDS